jgi:hypothetical protein
MLSPRWRVALRDPVDDVATARAPMTARSDSHERQRERRRNQTTLTGARSSVHLL